MDFTCCFRRWRRWIGFIVVITYIIVLVIALPLCIWELEKTNASDHVEVVEAWFIGGIFVMMALPISFWGILQHIINYTHPLLQRHIIRILWMVPIYALNAWFALRFPSIAIYLDTLRECYEAYVIYNFMAYLLSFLHSEYPHLEIQVENKPPVKHLFPICFLPPCQNGRKFIQRCKHGVLQYTVIRPAMTVIALMCEMFGKYGEGDLNFKTAFSYLVLINNASQILAMYCLVLFYKAFKDELKPLNPIPKFVCVKAVVFMSFWQALMIAILVKVDVIPQNGTWVFYKNIHEVASGIQDFLICIEMFIAAIAHYYSFSHKPFINLAAEQQNCCESFLSMWNISDVTEDVVEHARYIGRGVNKRLNTDRLWRGNNTESSPLLYNVNRNRLQRVNMQNRMTPSPGIVLENEEARPFDFDNSSNDFQSDSFVKKSTTLSLNNYAEFSESCDVSEDSRRASHASANVQIHNGSDDEKVRPIQVEDIQTEFEFLNEEPASPDEKFEEIFAEEANEKRRNATYPLNPPGADENQFFENSESGATDTAAEKIIPDDQMDNTSNIDDDHNPSV